MMDPTAFVFLLLFTGWTCFFAGVVLTRRAMDRAKDYEVRNLRRVCGSLQLRLNEARDEADWWKQT